jgi:hypothetical protein
MAPKGAVQKELEVPSWDLVLKRNSIEQMKREKFPLDVIDDLPRLIAAGGRVPGGCG